MPELRRSEKRKNEFPELATSISAYIKNLFRFFLVCEKKKKLRNFYLGDVRRGVGDENRRRKFMRFSSSHVDRTKANKNASHIVVVCWENGKSSFFSAYTFHIFLRVAWGNERSYRQAYNLYIKTGWNNSACMSMRHTYIYKAKQALFHLMPLLTQLPLKTK